MTKYIFAYHGGKMPDTPEEGAKVMQAWNNWYAKIGPSLADGGGPVGQSVTVTSSSVTDNGGANPVSGYTVVNADSIEDAIELAKGCPILTDGTVEVAPIIEM